MSVTVTIHHGELKQIKRLIEEKKTKTVKGQLYGLWTHSYQPVIQYVTGDLNPNESKEVKEHLEVYHGLKHVGNWSTRVDGGKESKLKRKSTCGFKSTSASSILVHDNSMFSFLSLVSFSDHDFSDTFSVSDPPRNEKNIH